MLLRLHRLVEYLEYRFAEQNFVAGILNEPTQVRRKGLDHDQVFDEFVDEEFTRDAVIACKSGVADKLAALGTLGQR